MKALPGLVLIAVMAGGVSAGVIEIQSSADHWIREIAPDTVYNDDGISVFSVAADGHLTNVFNLAGGMKAWGEKKYPLLNNPK